MGGYPPPHVCMGSPCLVCTPPRPSILYTPPSHSHVHPAWFHAYLVMCSHFVYSLSYACGKQGRGACRNWGGGARMHTHTPLHTLYALPICTLVRKQGVRVSTPHFLHMANRAHGKGGGHTCNGGEGHKGGG